MAGLRTERHANSDLVPSLLDRVGHHAIDPHRGEEQTENPEQAEQRGAQPRAAERLAHQAAQCSHVSHR